MKIYAVRDRLIDYFMQPFVAPGDKEVQAALANTINNNGDSSAISQAPHHFELWSLGQVTEDGHLVAERTLICDCSSLIRTGLRQRSLTEDPATAAAARQSPPEHRGNGQAGGAYGGPLSGPPQAAEGPTDEVRRGPQGGYPPRDG